MKTDSELQRDVLDELKWEPSINAAHIGVSVNDGIVTLSGHVTSYQARHCGSGRQQRHPARQRALARRERGSRSCGLVSPRR
jgi:BON domain